MQSQYALMGIATALALGAVSPGPSFLLVARTAASSGRLNGLSAALGMGCGGFVFAGLSMAGLISLLATVPAIYMSMKVVGGLYLAYLGYKMWRNALRLIVADNTFAISQCGPLRSFALGLATQLSNPKTAVVYASVFAVFLPSVTSLQFKLSVMLLVFTIETGWYALVATLLSSSKTRRYYLQFKMWIDRVAGGMMWLLGIRLAVSSQE